MSRVLAVLRWREEQLRSIKVTHAVFRLPEDKQDGQLIGVTIFSAIRDAIAVFPAGQRLQCVPIPRGGKGIKLHWCCLGNGGNYDVRTKCGTLPFIPSRNDVHIGHGVIYVL